MRLLLRVAPVLFWLAYGLFRSRLFRSSRLRHRLAMKLFRLAAEQGHRRPTRIKEPDYLAGDSKSGTLDGYQFLCLPLAGPGQKKPPDYGW